MKFTQNEIEEAKKICSEASPGPWQWNSYSRIDSVPLIEIFKEWESHIPENLDGVDWKKLAAEEPKFTVCRMPVRCGDTITEQGEKDARFIEHVRTAYPEALEEIERLREALQEMSLSFDGRSL